MTSFALLGAFVVPKCLKNVSRILLDQFALVVLNHWLKKPWLTISNVIKFKIAYRTIQNMTKCLRALTNPSPNRGKVDSIDYLPIECKKVISGS